MKTVSFALVLAVLLAVSCGSEQETGDPGTVDNGLPVCTLAIVDSIGIELGDSTFVFGSIEGLGHSPDGNVVVLDRISADVRVFSRSGEHLLTIAGRGGGPGELRNPLGLQLFPDGRIGVMDPWRTGLHTYSAEGEYLELALSVSSNVHLGPFTVVGDSEFVSAKTEFIFEDGAAPEIAVFVGLFPMTVEPTVTYWREQTELDVTRTGDLAQRYLFYPSWTADPASGRVYVAPFFECDYRILRFEPDGTELPTLELEVDPVPLTTEEMRLEQVFIEERLRALEGGDPDYSVEIIDPWDHRLPVLELDVDGEGLLWARRGTEDDPFFDIWSPDGVLLGQAVLPGLGPRSLSLRFSFDEGGILAYDEDPDLYQQIYIVEVVGGNPTGMSDH